jgi:hypothetical protein
MSHRPKSALVAALAVGLVAGVAVLFLAVATHAAPAAGYDVSYPQCSSAYPSHPVFGVVGVNGGLANNPNACLKDELRWARDTPGQRRPRQPRVSLYVDTGNPGATVEDWPRAGAAPAYGACNGELTDACSYLYGEQRATRSYQLVASLDARGASTAPWWLDVELTASWAKTYELNIATLQGFIAGLHDAGVTGLVGIYSTAAQWKDITGLTARTTVTAFNGALPDWVAGDEASLSRARQDCMGGDFTGETPTLAQYRIGHEDADLRCRPRP